MKVKWILAVVGALLIALSVVMADADATAQRTARAAVGTGLERVRAAASAEILQVIGEESDE